jgi:hypothetical protein
MEANVIDTLITQAQVASKSCVTAADNWLGYLQNAREQSLRVAASLADARRVADAERARLRTEIDKSRKELDQVNLSISDARKDLERTLKARDNLKAEMRSLYDHFVSQKVA